MRTIAIANQKGGCGKTTVSVNLASSLSFLGKKVLLIDLDPQSHASLGLGIKSENLSSSIYDVLDESPSKPATLKDVRIAVSSLLHLVPSEVVLSAIEQKLAGVAGRENRLYESLKIVEQEYDFAVIDCPPSLGLLTFNALRAAKELIIPAECSSYSLHGLAKILETVKLLDDALSHKMIVHALLNDFDGRTRFSKRIQEELGRLFSKQLFRTVIRHSVRLREAAACGKPIAEYDSQSVVFQDFLNLSAEVIEEEMIPQKEISFDVFDVPQFGDFSDFANSGEIQRETQSETRSILFIIKAPRARYVQIAGDFNQWVPEELLPPIKEGGIWRKLYHLKSGTYKYKFIVDGEWTIDPQNPRQETNPYGGSDSVLEVGVQSILDGR